MARISNLSDAVSLTTLFPHPTLIIKRSAWPATPVEVHTDTNKHAVV